ncbi:hypothetical protein V5O48_014556, partial [Marasmius crinis-equi]
YVMERQHKVKWEMTIKSLPGGDALLNRQLEASKHAKTFIPYAYLTPNLERDGAAHRLLENSQISVPEMDLSGQWLAFTCYSSLAVSTESNPIQYSIQLAFDSHGSCTCLDWMQQGGACKHIHAGLLKISKLNESKAFRIRTITLPTSLAAAQALHAQIQYTPKAEHRPVDKAAAIVNDIIDRTSPDVYEDDFLSPGEILADREDTASVITDASNDGRDPNFDIHAFYAVPTSKDAFTEQAIARTFHEFERAAPKMSEWTEYLLNVSSLPTTSNLTRARRLEKMVAELHSQLERLCIVEEKFKAPESLQARVNNSAGSGLNVEKEERKNDTCYLSSPQNHPQSLDSLQILPPSPEKGPKKWKISYGSY